MDSIYVKRKRFIINTLYISIMLAVVYGFLKYALGAISPFVFAFAFALMLKSPSRRLSALTGIPYAAVALVAVLLFYGTAAIIVGFAGVKIIALVTALLNALPGLYENQLMPMLMGLFARIENIVYHLEPGTAALVDESFRELATSVGNLITGFSLTVVGLLSNLATSLPGIFIRTLLMVITTFFATMDYEKISVFVARQLSSRQREVAFQIKDYLKGTLFVVVRSYLMIMSITFIELSIGLTLIGIEKAMVVALIIAIFDVLPVLGTGGIMIPWAIITAINGDTSTAAGLAVVYVFITIIRNILEPKIVGGQLGLHPIVTLMSMFIGASLFGAIGLFGFPITLSLLRYLNEHGVISLYK